MQRVKFFTWYILLSKRLLKKVGFLAMLITLLILTLGIKFFSSREESSVLKIGLYIDKDFNKNIEEKTRKSNAKNINTSDDLSQNIIDNLLRKNSIINFSKVNSYDDIYNKLSKKELDAVWAFPPNLSSLIENYSNSKNKLIRLIEQDDTVPLKLSREILFKELYPYISFSTYKNFLINELKPEDISTFENEITSYYDNINVTGDLIEYKTYNENENSITENPKNNSSFLLSPLRGLISIWLFSCGILGAAYYCQDLKNGLFTLIPIELRANLAIFYQLYIVVNAAIIMLASLFLTGLFVDFTSEMINIIMLILSITLFSNLLRLVLKNNATSLVSLIPVIIVLSLVSSPVFLSINTKFQYLLPINFYLRLFYQSDILIKFICYILVLVVVNVVLIGVNRKE